MQVEHIRLTPRVESTRSCFKALVFQPVESTSLSNSKPFGFILTPSSTCALTPYTADVFCRLLDAVDDEVVAPGGGGAS